MKKIIYFLGILILFCSCEKINIDCLSPSDKFVGKYRVSGVLYDEYESYEDSEDNIGIVYITKVDNNTVHISELNKDAKIDKDKLIIDKFYDRTEDCEYDFSPAVYSNGMFSLKGKIKDYKNREILYIEYIFVKF